MHRSKRRHYSITSSATTCSDCGTLSLSIRVVWALMTSSNLVLYDWHVRGLGAL